MKVAALFSGGKDSTYATYKAMALGHEVEFLVTIVPEREDSWMFHHQNIRLTTVQAELMGLKQIIVSSSGVREKELEDLFNVLSRLSGSIEGIVSGAIASKYQKTRIDRVCEALGLESIAPLWGRDPVKLMYEQLDSGIEAMIVGCYAMGLNEKWLGRKIDEEAIRELEGLYKKYGVNPAGEGGEIETFVLDCPLFTKRIEVVETEKKFEGGSGHLNILTVKLREKTAGGN